MKLSDYLFFGAAFLSLAFSVYLWFIGQREEGIFVGLWVPSILTAANYIKNLRSSNATNKS